MAKDSPPPAPKPPAIVLATFGTTRPEALGGILNVQARVQQAFPGLPVRLAFTSNQVRQVWQQRAGDPAWIKANPSTPREVLEVQTPLAAIAQLQDQGHRHIVVQSLHIFAGEEYQDLGSLVAALGHIRTVKAKWAPFTRLALGRPALGEPGEEHPYPQDIAAAAAALKPDVEAARARGEALVYMGHGNELFSTGVYAELEEALRRDNPGAVVCVGVVVGFPGQERVLADLKAARAAKAVLRPLMLVAGEHAMKDMCGQEESWRTALEKEGVAARCELRGLGEVDAFAELYVEHLRDALQAGARP